MDDGNVGHVERKRRTGKGREIRYDYLAGREEVTGQSTLLLWIS
jgi:hypothetical protein